MSTERIIELDKDAPSYMPSYSAPGGRQRDTASETGMIIVLVDDPGLRSLIGGDSSVMESVFLATIGAASIGGHIYAAVNEDAKMVGVAVWWGPGENPSRITDEHRQQGIPDVQDLLTPETLQWYKDTVSSA
ncbi:hypothetical protein VNI00_014697 [Paramarasmius palmivorus]|uniref:Uncharacterized protein n=1 Tax=Paramarasmius palmivorus TaxID=297713 RepID=A0AAW0BQX7_9AGAR